MQHMLDSLQDQAETIRFNILQAHDQDDQEGLTLQYLKLTTLKALAHASGADSAAMIAAIDRGQCQAEKNFYHNKPDLSC